jgi:leucyl-tRNA synthetase
MLRFTSPGYKRAPFIKARVKKWLPVDQYTGGAEHAVMHLLYSRFFIKALRDMELVDFGEPFLRLFNQGIIISGGAKMSKSRGNVVAPDEYVQAMGADVVRAYLMFVGPWDQGGDWSDAGINGVARWMNRLWELCARDPNELAGKPHDAQAVRATVRTLHQTIKKCYGDLDKFKFNTAVAALMEFSNHLGRVWSEGTIDPATARECVEKLLLMLAPIAPHITEELWERTGHAYSIHQQPFPKWDEALAAEETNTLVVQVEGKVRDKLDVPAGITEQEARRLALASPRVQPYLGGKPPAKVVYVPGRLVSVVPSR